MADCIELSPAYSTTRRLHKISPEEWQRELETAQTPKHKSKVLGSQPEGEGWLGDGGLRTKGYYKKASEEQPLVTVITVVFNAQCHLEETILSVVNQSYQNLEYIIIDGGSTDGTLDIIRKFEHVIDYWVSEKDKGIYDGMNKGISLSSGPWLNFMNSGDRFNGDKIIEKIFSKKQNTEFDFIYSDALLPNGMIASANIEQNKIIHQSLIYRKDIHHDVGNYIVSKGVSISDYFFFMLSKNKAWIKIDDVISIFNFGGISEKFSHHKQKVAVDLMLNDMAVAKAIYEMSISRVFNLLAIFLFRESRLSSLGQSLQGLKHRIEARIKRF